MKSAGLISCIAVVLLTNGMALLHALRVRSQEPTRVITLTERELPRERMEIDDSGVALRLAWKYREPAVPAQRGGIRNAFDQSSLEKMDFSIPSPGDWWTMRRPQSGLRFAVFELDLNAVPQQEKPAPASISQAQQGQADQGDRTAANNRSRLTFLEASSDLRLLWDKYADQEKYLIAPVAITLNAISIGGDTREKPERLEWRGRVSEVLPILIQVPLPFSTELSRKLSSTSGTAAYRVTLKYSQDLEPWVTDVK